MTLKGWIWLVLIGVLFTLIGCASVQNEEDARVVPTTAPLLDNPATTTPSSEDVTTVPAPTPTTPPTATSTETEELPVPTQVPEGEARIVQQVASPDGQWMATTTYTDFDVQGPIAGTFTLTHLQTNEEIVLENLVVAEGSRWLEVVPLPLAWQADSQAFYYTYGGVPIDGCFIPFANPLHQYTLATGSHDILATPAGSEHTFSPNGAQVAYFPLLPADAPPALAIYAPATDGLQEIPFPEFDPSLAFMPEVTGEMLWHPDGTAIALAVQVAHCTNPTPALLVVDLLTSEIRVVEVGVHFYTLDRWEGNILFLHGYRLLRQYDIEAGAWVGE